VVAATNAFTAQLFPELREIKPRQSQIQVTDHAPDRTRGRVVTCEDGPVFFNQPRDAAANGRAPLLMGGGADRPMRTPSSRRRSPQVHQQLLDLRARYFPELNGHAPSAEWIGAMAFTPDQLPAIGPLRPGVIVASACNGYGGSYTTATGLAAATMALTGAAPDWIPEDVFSPKRLLRDDPLFMTKQDSLWRIATSLCRQLKLVDRQITETLALRAGRKLKTGRYRTPMSVTTMMRAAPQNMTPASTIDPEKLRALESFADFTVAEATHLLSLAKRCDLPRGRVLFREGEPGDSCFILVEGQLDVSVRVRQERHLLAQLNPGAVFGQVSVIAAEPRSASCAVRKNALLVQLDRPACEALLRDAGPLAVKFLGALNQGLTEALRAADRRLVRLRVEAFA
jgi:hypothetical protein